ncbi:MAG: extracellular solute-binding protein [Treponema sp.]|nr:extracellular solute-binding protein [Treponema sp.]
MKKKLCIFMSLLMAISICGAVRLYAGGTSQSAPAAASGPTEIKILAPYWSAEIPENTIILQKLQDLTNTKLSFDWIPPTSLSEKAALVIASQELPDVMEAQNSYWKTQFLVDAIRSGMFWELGPLFNNYSNLKNLDINWDYGRYDGKIFGVPRMVLKRPAGMIIRLDWLENLGLKMPQTTDEFYNVLKAFTAGDPAKTGRNDTFGVAMNGLGILNPVVMSLGMNPYWYEDKDGQILPAFYQTNYIDALKFIKKVYDEGLMNQDFMSTNQGNIRNSFFQGKAGIVTGGAIGMISDGAFNAVFNNPGAKIAPLGAFKGPDGILSCESQPNFNCFYMIPKPSVKTQDKVDKILAFFNRTMDPEVFNLFYKGVEGVHYRMDGDQTVIIDQAQLTKDLAPMLSLYVLPQIVANLQISDKPELRLGYDFQVANYRDYAQTDQYFIAKVPTTQLAQIMNDANSQFVAGQINEAQWRAAIDNWNKAGGTALIADYTEQNKLRSKQ